VPLPLIPSPMKTLLKPMAVGLVCLLVVGCRTPEERAVDAMESVDKAMIEMEKKLKAMERDMEKRTR